MATPRFARVRAWRWQGRLGTNGHTALGSVTLNTEGPQRRELFFEREALETQAGVERGQMYNIAGAALDQRSRST